jgi:hypothetical protein
MWIPQKDIFFNKLTLPKQHYMPTQKLGHIIKSIRNDDIIFLIGRNFLRSYPFYPPFGGKIRGEMKIACAVQFSFFCGKHESGNGSCQGMALCHYPALRDACTLCTQKHTAKRKLYRIVCSPDRRCIL